MKILHIIFSLNTGGAETMLVDLVNAQSESLSVELIVINNSVNEVLINALSKNVKLHLINRTPGSRRLIKILHLNFLIWRINPHIIHYHNHNAIQLIRVVTSLPCLTVHGLMTPATNFYKYRKLFSISNAVRMDVVKRSDVESSVVYNGIDFSKIKAKSEFWKNGTFKIVQVSRLDHMVKGQDLLLKAIHHLVYRLNIRNLEIHFIGGGPSLRYLEELAKQYKLMHIVKFLGDKDRRFIYDSLKDYDLLIQPSRTEGFGLTIIEGVAAGLPVIVSDCEGPAEIMNTMPGGWVFNLEDEEALHKAILEVIEFYKFGKIQQLTQKNYLSAINIFSIEQTSKNYIINYNKLFA